MKPRIILEGTGMKPELPRCILCNEQKYIYSDTRLCEKCDQQSLDKNNLEIHKNLYHG